MHSLLAASILVATALPCAAEESAAQLVARWCTPCHSESSNPLQPLHLTRQQWQQAIERMAAYGVAIPDEKLQELLDHLARAYGTSPAEGGASPAPTRPNIPRRNNP